MTHTTTTRFLAAALPLIFAACSQHPSSDTNAATPAASAPPVSASSAAAASAPVPTPADEADEKDENGGSTAAASAPSQSDPATHGPHIKGIALGQTPEQVHAALTAMLPPGTPCTISPEATQLVCDGTAQPLQGTFRFEAGHLSEFKFYSALSSLTFGRMPSSDFVQAFMSAYGIPRMDPAQDNPMFSAYLRYRDDSGWEAGVYPDNTFYVRAVETAQARTQKFN